MGFNFDQINAAQISVVYGGDGDVAGPVTVWRTRWAPSSTSCCKATDGARPRSVLWWG